MTAITSRPPTSAEQGGHVCLTYDDLQDELPTLLSVLHEGLQRPAGERTLVVTALEGEHVVVHVVDQGPNVEPPERDVVFGFLTSTVAGRRRGSGSGLPASKRLVEPHGRRIWTQPSATGSTKFVLTLPIASEGGKDGQ